MSRNRAHAASVGGVALAVSAFVLAGCSSAGNSPSASGSGSGSANASASVDIPLATTQTAPYGAATAVVAMGTLSDPLDTFWQIFSRTDASAPWRLVTPPGVADNGGLVISSSSVASGAAGGSAVQPSPVWLAGFLPSQDLRFSPLATSADNGGSWSPGLLDEALAATPDSLAVSAGSRMVALEDGSGGEVLSSDGSPTDWTEVVDLEALARTVTGRRCSVRRLTAVALDPTGRALVGASCGSSARAGIFSPSATGGQPWSNEGPELATSLYGRATTVVQLVDRSGSVGALVEAPPAPGGGGRAGGPLFVTTTTPSAPSSNSATSWAWGLSPVLELPPGSRVLSTAATGDGGFAVVFSSAGSIHLAFESSEAGAWNQLAGLPAATATVAVSPGGLVDALAVHSTELDDWRYEAQRRSWVKMSTVTVPIQFGSSS